MVKMSRQGKNRQTRRFIRDVYAFLEFTERTILHLSYEKRTFSKAGNF